MIDVYVMRRRHSNKCYCRSFSSIEDAARFIMRPGVFGKILSIKGISSKQEFILHSKINSMYRKEHPNLT